MTDIADSTISEKLLTKHEVMAIVGFSRSLLERGVKAGTFPKPYCVSHRRIAWKRSDIDSWLNSLVQIK